MQGYNNQPQYGSMTPEDRYGKYGLQTLEYNYRQPRQQDNPFDGLLFGEKQGGMRDTPPRTAVANAYIPPQQPPPRIKPEIVRPGDYSPSSARPDMSMQRKLQGTLDLYRRMQESRQPNTDPFMEGAGIPPSPGPSPYPYAPTRRGDYTPSSERNSDPFAAGAGIVSQPTAQQQKRSAMDLLGLIAEGVPATIGDVGEYATTGRMDNAARQGRMIEQQYGSQQPIQAPMGFLEALYSSLRR